MDLDWIASQQAQMETQLERLVNINSYTENLEGLKRMADELEAAFKPLKAEMARLLLPPRTCIDSQGEVTKRPLGEALHLIKRPNAPFRLFLGGHMDTVYPPTHPFQKAERLAGRLNGPGALDMKGGLLILLTLLHAIERSSFAPRIGWEVLINPDEEIGSVGSRNLLAECASRNHLGLIFEPAFPDGQIVSSRKGSATFTIVARGRAAHAGRDFASGRNALTALAKFILKAEALTDLEKGTTVNIGQLQSGEAVNVVPVLAISRLNVRVTKKEALDELQSSLRRFAKEADEGVTLFIHEDAATPPKEFDEKQRKLFELLKACGEELHDPIQWRPSGGTCDGNRLQANGLRSIDTLGAIGGGMHTEEEYVDLPSLSKRAQLAALFVERMVAKI